MGFDNDKLRDSRADLHERVGDAVQAILGKRVHRLLHGSKLIGRVLVKDR